MVIVVDVETLTAVAATPAGVPAVTAGTAAAVPTAEITAPALPATVAAAMTASVDVAALPVKQTGKEAPVKLSSFYRRLTYHTMPGEQDGERIPHMPKRKNKSE